MAAATTPDSDKTGPALAVLLGVVLFSLVGFGAVIPLLPAYGKIFDAPAWQVTLLFAMFSLGQFMGELFWGPISDRIGRRPVLMITMIGSALAFLGFAFAPSIWLAVLARWVSGFFNGNMSAVQGYVADVSPPEKLNGRLSLMGAMFGMGFVIGPVMGGLLANPAAGAAGMRPPILLAAALYLTASVGVAVFVRESRRPRKSVTVGPFAALTIAAADPVVSRLLLTTFASFVAFSAVMPTLGIWSQEKLDWTPREVGLALAAASGCGALAQTIYARTVGRRVRETSTICGSMLFSSVALAVLATSTSAGVALFWLVLAVIGNMVPQPATAALISRLSSPDHQGAILGANSAAGALARVMGPVIAGLVISGFNSSAPFLFAAVGVLPAAWLALSAARRHAAAKAAHADALVASE